MKSYIPKIKKPLWAINQREIYKTYTAIDDKIIAAIIGFAIGDALGVPVEFTTRDELSKNPIKGMSSGGTHGQLAGTWSDDTSLMLALIDAISEEFSVENVAYKMMDWFYDGKYTANGEVFDIGTATRNAITYIRAGFSPTETGGTEESDNGNGSLMRILPLAFYLYNETDFDTRKNVIYDISSITHAHIISKTACHFLVEWLIECLKTNDVMLAYENECNIFTKTYKEDLIQSQFRRIFTREVINLPASKIRSTGYVVDTLESVIWCTFNSNSYKDAVLMAVNLGNDTDTIGAITGGVAGLIYGYNSIPQKWEKQLRNKRLIYNSALKCVKKMKGSQGVVI